MNLGSILCMSAVSIVLLLAYVFQWRGGAISQSHDALADLMLRMMPFPPCWFVIWFALSGVLGVVVPFAARQDLEWFAKANGLVITVNYTFAVPILVAAYMTLVRTLKEFLTPKNLADVGIVWATSPITDRLFSRRLWNIFSKIVLAVSTLVITWAAIQSIVGTESGNPSPWAVDAQTLSAAGIAYYALRGVNAYLALGLILLAVGVFAVFIGRLKLQDPRRLLDEHLNVKASVQDLTTALVLCAFLGGLVTVLHGHALLLESTALAAAQGTSDGPQLALLLESTWLYWAVLAFVATFSLLFGVFWLHMRVREGVAQHREAMNDAIEALYKSSGQQLEDYAARLEALTQVRTYMDIAGPAAMPKGGLVLVVGSLLVQAINVGSALNEILAPS